MLPDLENILITFHDSDRCYLFVRFLTSLYIFVYLAQKRILLSWCGISLHCCKVLLQRFKYPKFWKIPHLFFSSNYLFGLINSNFNLVNFNFLKCKFTKKKFKTWQDLYGPFHFLMESRFYQNQPQNFLETFSRNVQNPIEHLRWN